jgi:hypothetical protein
MTMNKAEELIRISQEYPERIEYSTDRGKSWHIRYIKGASGDCKALSGKNIEISTVSSKTYHDKENEKD